MINLFPDLPLEFLIKFRLFALIVAGAVATLSVYVWRYYVKCRAVFKDKPHPKLVHVIQLSISHFLMVVGSGVVIIHRFHNRELSVAIVLFFFAYLISVYSLARILHFVYIHSRDQR